MLMIDAGQMVEFLVLCRDKVNHVIGEISIQGPLQEVSAMLTGKIEELQREQGPFERE